MGKLRAIVKGTGSYLPETVLDNHDLEKLVDTSDEWITTRTGIKQRRIASAEEASSDLGYEAAVRCLENAQVKPEDVDIILVATLTPDYLIPSTAALIQNKLKATNAWGFDMESACSGFVFALNTAGQYIENGTYRNALVIATECLSKVTNYKDRTSCILFGDGAGAVLLQGSDEETERGVMYMKMGIDGSGGEYMIIPAGGSRKPASQETVENDEHFMIIRGREVYKFAVKTMQDLLVDALEHCDLSSNDVKLVVPHQVNQRILESVINKIDMSGEKIYINIDKYGNTSAASIPIALDEAAKEGKIKKGDIVILVAFGSGLSWGSSVIRW